MLRREGAPALPHGNKQARGVRPGVRRAGLPSQSPPLTPGQRHARAAAPCHKSGLIRQRGAVQERYRGWFTCAGDRLSLEQGGGSHVTRQPCPEPREFGHLRLMVEFGHLRLVPGLRVTRRPEERAGGRAPQQPHHGTAGQPVQHGEVGPTVGRVTSEPRRPRKAPVSSSVARPNSTVDRMRAQFRPRPLARAIHSHRATGTRAQSIDTVMNSVVSWLTWAAVRWCPRIAW